jgi:uncharacterized membrane protein
MTTLIPQFLATKIVALLINKNVMVIGIVVCTFTPAAMPTTSASIIPLVNVTQGTFFFFFHQQNKRLAQKKKKKNQNIRLQLKGKDIQQETILRKQQIQESLFSKHWQLEMLQDSKKNKKFVRFSQYNNILLLYQWIFTFIIKLCKWNNQTCPNN